MPIAIVLSKDTLPALVKARTNDKLLEDLRQLKSSPPLECIEDARSWLDNLPPPSGWYETEQAAKAAIDRLKHVEIPSAQAIKSARSKLGLSRAAFARALGYTGNTNTNSKQVNQLEQGERRLTADKALRLQALLAEQALSEMSVGETV